jgi:GNAT superfamily N-acetyltransferase
MGDEWRRGEYTISTDAARIDLDVVHGYLARSYWSRGVARDVVARSIAGSLNFGLYLGDVQVGFARVITDYAAFAYLADVFVLEEHRGRGLGVWLVETIVAHPALQGLRVFRLATKDAHSLYEKAGFRPLAHPERMMEIVTPDLYIDEENESGAG